MGIYARGSDPCRRELLVCFAQVPDFVPLIVGGKGEVKCGRLAIVPTYLGNCETYPYSVFV
jgi:hypothetical protein